MTRALVTFVFALAAFAPTASAGTVSYAVIVGNNEPPSAAAGATLGTLRYADDDAVRYYALLSQFSRTTLLSTLDDPTQRRHPRMASVARTPSLEGLRQVFAALGDDMRRDRKAGHEPVLYFVFAGHGAVGEAGDAYLALLDARLTQKILFDELIGSLPTPRTHVIVDACHGAGVVGARGVFDTETTGATAPLSPSESIEIAGGGALQRYPHVGVIVATTLGNETHEWSAIEAGVFSHEVLSGLAGPADVNGDLVVEYSELHAFVANANRSIANPRAVPIVVAQPPRADRRSPLVRLPELRASYLLRGNVGPWGRFSVELDDGRRLVDAHLSGERPVTVALPIGTPAYVRTAAGDARVTSAGPQLAVSSVHLSPPMVASRNASVDADYRLHLFASPYGPAYYSGFVDSHDLVSVDFDIRVHLELPLAALPLAELPAPLAVPPTRDRRAAKLLLGVSITSGAVALIAATVGFASWYEVRDASVRRDALEGADTYHTASWVFWPAVAVTALSAYGSWKLNERSRRVYVAPTIDPQGRAPGLSLGGSF